jgi:hypothetical protein
MDLLIRSKSLTRQQATTKANNNQAAHAVSDLNLAEVWFDAMEVAPE